MKKVIYHTVKKRSQSQLSSSSHSIFTWKEEEDFELENVCGGTYCRICLCPCSEYPRNGLWTRMPLRVLAFSDEVRKVTEENKLWGKRHILLILKGSAITDRIWKEISYCRDSLSLSSCFIAMSIIFPHTSDSLGNQIWRMLPYVIFIVTCLVRLLSKILAKLPLLQ